MNLTDYKVKEIRYPHGTYRLGEAAEIIDEGNFYRICIGYRWSQALKNDRVGLDTDAPSVTTSRECKWDWLIAISMLVAGKAENLGAEEVSRATEMLPDIVSGASITTGEQTFTWISCWMPNQLYR